MASQIQNTLNSVLGDGARSTKFSSAIIFSNTGLFNDSSALNTLLKSTSFPGMTHEKIDFKYKGRSIPIKGQTKYTQQIECTFYNTEDHKLKWAFEIWMSALDQNHTYTEDVFSGIDIRLITYQMTHGASSYATNMKLYQTDFEGNIKTAEYELFNVFPIEISNIQVSSEGPGNLEEFTVVFAYSHYILKTNKGAAGNFIDGIVGAAKGLIGSVIQGAMDYVGNTVKNIAKDAIGGNMSTLNSLGTSIQSDIRSLNPFSKTDGKDNNIRIGTSSEQNVVKRIEEQSTETKSQRQARVNEQASAERNMQYNTSAEGELTLK